MLDTPFQVNDRAFIYVSGADAASFLQGQISNDVDLLTSQDSLHALILTPQGKILADLFLYNYQNGYLIDIHQSIADWLLKRFTMFKLRSDVVFEDVSASLNLVISSAILPNALISAPDPRTRQIIRNISSSLVASTAPDEYFEFMASQALIEFGTNYQASEHFPQDLWFDKLGSISFTKGCYVGQEVVSRMRHKSDARKRLLPLFSNSHSHKSDKIMLNGKAVGEVICQVGSTTLAVMRIDKLPADIQQLDDFEIKRPEWILSL